MSINELQQELCEKLANIVIESDNNVKNVMHSRMIEIIDELKDHINDIIEYNGMGGTALDYVTFFDTRNYDVNGRLNNPVLVALEVKVKNLGGKMSELEIESSDNEESEGEGITEESEDEDIIIDYLSDGNQINTLLENTADQLIQQVQNR
ncbi:MAG: hypothetical protein PG981_000735 [Wolbachia endosymbiont of Ctenocephalides orientis wCori]|nr:MAG: hypothetical protein PG981_000735 [Wolbachia endosymbiont of Ctenocephalides orientis wCori]